MSEMHIDDDDAVVVGSIAAEEEEEEEEDVDDVVGLLLFGSRVNKILKEFTPMDFITIQSVVEKHSMDTPHGTNEVDIAKEDAVELVEAEAEAEEDSGP